MSRAGRDQIGPDGYVVNGYDYGAQCWVRHGLVVPCGHPATMRVTRPCCTANQHQGRRIQDVPGAERRAA